MSPLLLCGVPEKAVVRVSRMRGEHQLIGTMEQIRRIGHFPKTSSETGHLTEFTLVMRSSGQKPKSLRYFLVTSFSLRGKTGTTGIYYVYQTLSLVSLETSQDMADNLIQHGFRYVRS